ncbi:hypothetical protein EBF16_05570 [Sphingobium yanoikuyae]|uniref:Uncharacterized protein n=1 Tax=Sphingobium yanoikuyae TaxID=13690 RepID=A0A3G2UUQ1_SPHYA|nr:hypothetical protein EBF16_05570 [Sphingobium yanoikuyae]
MGQHRAIVGTFRASCARHQHRRLVERHGEMSDDPLVPAGVATAARGDDVWAAKVWLAQLLQREII